MREARLLNTVIAPHMSEKAVIASEKKNEYVFRVSSKATKPDIKEAIEHLFNTKVKCVRVVSVHPKKKMFKGRPGAHKAWKKAYVTLESDQKIDLIKA